MVTIALDDNTIKTMLLANIADKIARGNFQELLDAGFKVGTIDNIRSIRLENISRLMDFNLPTISFEIDEDELIGGLKKIENEDRIINDLSYFIKYGATRKLTVELFGPDLLEEKISDIYQLIGGNAKRGRSSMPDHKTRDQIHQSWHDLTHMNHEQNCTLTRTALIALHQMFSDLSIDSLYSTINEFRE